MKISLDIKQNFRSIRIPLTKKQEDVFNVIVDYFAKYGCSPTRSELLEEVSKKWNKSITRQAIDAHLNLIAKKGWLKITKKSPRNLVININELNI